LFILSAGCSESVSADGPDGQNECLSDAYLRFSSPLAGQGVGYSVTVKPDLGTARVDFDVPFTCSVTTGTVSDRSSACTSVPQEQYGDISQDEVSPPVLQFQSAFINGKQSDSWLGVRWGYDSTRAAVTLRQGDEIIFEGSVNFSIKTCNNGARDVDYREAVVDLNDATGGAGGSQ
jgi:hypothetical protein